MCRHRERGLAAPPTLPSPSRGGGAAVGAGMAMLFVQVLAPLFSIPPASRSVPAGELSLWGTLVLCSMALAALLAGRSIRGLNPAELLREE